MYQNHTRGMTPIGVALILALIILGGSGAYLYQKGNRAALPPAPEPVATTTPVVSDPTADWATYTATSTYGFTIKYPADLATTSNFQSFYHVTGAWRQAAITDTKTKTTGERIVSIIVDSKKNAPGEEGYYVNMEVRIGASAKADQVAKCLLKEEDEDMGVAVTLGGASFTKFNRVSAGMSQFGHVSSYRTVRNDQCVAIETILAGGGTSGTDPSHDAALLEADQKAAEAIVATFAFVD